MYCYNNIVAVSDLLKESIHSRDGYLTLLTLKGLFFLTSFLFLKQYIGWVSASLSREQGTREGDAV